MLDPTETKLARLNQHPIGVANICAKIVYVALCRAYQDASVLNRYTLFSCPTDAKPAWC